MLCTSIFNHTLRTFAHQRSPNPGIPVVLNYGLREAKRKHGLGMDAVMKPQVSELSLLSQFSQREM